MAGRLDSQRPNGMNAGAPLVKDLEVTASPPEMRPEDVAVAPSLLPGHRSHMDMRAVWQITSMSLGVGVFTIPSAFMALGVVLGSVMVVVLGIFANFAQQRLLDAAALHGIASYEGLAQHAFGTVGKALMAVLTFVTTFIASLSYMSTARELLVNEGVAFFVDFNVNGVPNGVTVLTKAKSVVLLSALSIAVAPLCLKKSMGANAMVSMMGVFVIVVSSLFFVGSCAVLLLMGCGSEVQCGAPPSAISSDIGDVLQFTSTLAFSFSTVFSIFPVLQERIIDGAIPEAVSRVKPAVTMGVTLCSGIYLLVGLLGVMTFGQATKPVALSNLPLTNPLTQVVTLLAGASSAALVAIISFPTVESLELIGSMLCGGRPSCCGDTRRWRVLGVFVVLVIIDSTLEPKIAFALCGSLGLATSAYIMPCALFFALGGGDRRRCHWLTKPTAALVLIFGCIVLFGSTPVTVMRLIRGGGTTPLPLKALLCKQAAE